MTQLFDDTLRCDAHVYLDSWSSEIKRDEFLAQLLDWHGYMLYIGDGYMPFRVAVATTNSYRFHRDGDPSEAVSSFEEWALKHRPDELEENPDTGEYTYTLAIQPLPKPICVMPMELRDFKL